MREEERGIEVSFDVAPVRGVIHFRTVQNEVL
jgi:hypothetical protein